MIMTSTTTADSRSERLKKGGGLRKPKMQNSFSKVLYGKK